MHKLNAKSVEFRFFPDSHHFLLYEIITKLIIGNAKDRKQKISRMTVDRASGMQGTTTLLVISVARSGVQVIRCSGVFLPGVVIFCTVDRAVSCCGAGCLLLFIVKVHPSLLHGFGLILVIDGIHTNDVAVEKVNVLLLICIIRLSFVGRDRESKRVTGLVLICGNVLLMQFVENELCQGQANEHFLRWTDEGGKALAIENRHSLHRKAGEHSFVLGCHCLVGTIEKGGPGFGNAALRKAHKGKERVHVFFI